MGTHASKDTLGCQEDIVGEVVATHALLIGHRVDLSEDLDELASLLVVLRRVHDDAAARLLSHFQHAQFLFSLDSFGDESASVCLNKH